MGRHRRPLITGLALGLLFGLDPAATRATSLPARLHPAGTIDTSFSDSTQQPGRVLTDFRGGSLEQARAIAIQADGKIVAAGWSTAPNGDDNFALVRYNVDGTPDISFGDNSLGPGRVLTDFRALPDGTRSVDEINAIVIQPDGKIVAGGFSTSPNGDQNFALVRYNSNGTIDTTFGDNTQQPGRVLIDFRALPDGTRSDDVINALALQPDGKIVAAGRSNSPNGDQNFALVRFNPNGTIDTSFGDNTQQPGRVLTDFGGNADEINAIILQADGKIVAGGHSGSAGPAGQVELEPQRQSITKAFQELAAQLQFTLAPAGDGLNGVEVSGPVWGLEMDKGDYFKLPGLRDIRVLQFSDSDRSAAEWSSFWAPPKPGEPPPPPGVTDTPTKVGGHDAYLVVGAQFSSNNRGPSRAASAYLAWRCENLWLVAEAIVTANQLHDDVNLITQTRQQFVAELQTLAATVDQKLTQAQACGAPASAGENFALVRYNANGTPDLGFGDGTGRVLTDFRALPDGSHSAGVINALALQVDGKIIAAGKSNSPNGDDNFALVRYNPNGTIDTSFGDSTQQPGRMLTDFRPLADNSRSTDEIRAIAIQPEGRLVAAGWSNSPNGDPNFAVVRYNPDGLIDTSFSDSTQQPGRNLTDFRTLPDNSRSSDFINAIAIQADAKIVVAGYSDSPNGDDNFAMVRYYGTPTIGPPPGTSPPNPPQPADKINLIVTLSALEVNGGTVVTGTVHLSRPAPSGGLKLVLKSDTPLAASVPDTLTIPAGTSSGTFAITTHSVSPVTDVGIFVDFADPLSPFAGDPDDVDLSLRPGAAPGTTPGTTPGTNPPPATGKIDVRLSLSAYKVKGGTVVTGTVQLSQPAPAGGLKLTFDSDAPDVVAVPGILAIPAGASSSPFPVVTLPVTADTEVDIFVDFADPNSAIAGSTDIVTLTVTP